MCTQPAAVLDSVSKLYGRFAALRRVSCRFERGRCYLLLGENGAGKSTLLRVLAGLLAPTLGRVSVLGQEPKLARAAIGYMGHGAMLYDELSATENLAYFASLYDGADRLTPSEALSSVGLDPALRRPVGQYSQGMRQRTSLARVLLAKPSLLLLDEPFSNMDAASAAQMLSLIARMRDEGRTVVLTTHQRELAAPIADWLLTMKHGSLAEALEVHAADLPADGVQARPVRL
jgi:heme ABC exporter ATP-binding subunit CcmA